MKDRSSVRKVGQWGKSLAVRLTRAEARALGVKRGDGVYVVVTDERTVELQPLAPPTPAARRRRYLSNRVRTLERECKRLREKARAAYQAGFNDGFFKGAQYGMRELWDRLAAVVPKLERFVDATTLGTAPDGSDGRTPPVIPPGSLFPRRGVH